MEDDPTRSVDEWPLPGLSPILRTKIKARLLAAHAAFIRAPWDGEFRYVGLGPMRQVFGEIAEILFTANLLTVELLENQLRLLVVEAALAGGWPSLNYDEPRTEIFPNYLGHAGAWARYNLSVPNAFTAEIAEWHSKLLDKVVEVGAQPRLPHLHSHDGGYGIFPKAEAAHNCDTMADERNRVFRDEMDYRFKHGEPPKR